MACLFCTITCMYARENIWIQILDFLNGTTHRCYANSTKSCDFETAVTRLRDHVHEQNEMTAP